MSLGTLLGPGDGLVLQGERENKGRLPLSPRAAALRPAQPFCCILLLLLPAPHDSVPMLPCQWGD